MTPKGRSYLDVFLNTICTHFLKSRMVVMLLSLKFLISVLVNMSAKDETLIIKPNGYARNVTTFSNIKEDCSCFDLELQFQAERVKLIQISILSLLH